MSTIRAPIKTFDYQCPDCGSIIRIPKQMTSRNRSRSVEGHIKDIWCYVCERVTKHVQLSEYRPFIEEVETDMKDWLVFSNPEFGQIRTIDINDKLFFVGVDVARALEYANPSKAVLDHCKGISKLGIPSEGGEQTTNVIPESDLYRLIVKAADQSRNPDIRAKGERFEKWIFEEVLPQIRKTGSYSIQPLSQLEILQKSINLLVEQEKKLQEHDKQIKEIKETVVYRPDNWRDDINKMFDRVARANDNRYRDMRAESYRILEERAGCDLDKRLENLQQRKKEAGATSTEISRTNKLDVIESDPKLREIYTTIIKELVIKYVA